MQLSLQPSVSQRLSIRNRLSQTPGAIYQLRDGRDVLLVSTGTQTVRCLEAAGLLAEAGISAGVLYVPSIKPVDTAAILQAAAVPLVVTVEEHTIYGASAG